MLPVCDIANPNEMLRASLIENTNSKVSYTFRSALKYFAALLAFLLVLQNPCQGYSVLSHEAVIDSCWDDAIRPLLLQRFPNSTSEDLKTAHSYAYGGAVIQDMGYYPFGSKLFSDLTHYVRSGDFVEALLSDAQNLNEYAFALGALAHYEGDNEGHRLAVNVSVPILYPKLRKKYGDVVVYDENPSAHLKTEFGFDVLQVARGHYAPDDYRDRVGFSVADDLLRRAFQDTYGLKMDDLFFNYDLAVGTYRWGVNAVIPRMTKAAWQIKKDEIQKSSPGLTRKQFLYRISRANYRRQYGGKYRSVGFGTRFLAFIIDILPKVGPLSALSFKTPTPQTEQFFLASFNGTVDGYEGLVRGAGASGGVRLLNDNFDTGTVTGPGQYPLADRTYADLTDRLAKNHFMGTPPELRRDILFYYNDLNAPLATKKNKKQWKRVVGEVSELRALAASSATADGPEEVQSGTPSAP
jgi:hypothetical protein